MKEVLINSWVFNFETMTATRDKNWHLYNEDSDRNTVCFHIDDGVLWKKAADITWRGYFFSDPEHDYNDGILRAYATYMFEKQVLT